MGINPIPRVPPEVRAFARTAEYVAVLNARADYVHGHIEIEEFETRLNRIFGLAPPEPINDYQTFAEA